MYKIQNKLLLVLLLGCLLCYACDEDTFTTIVEIDIPTVDRKLTLNGIFQVDKPMELDLYTSSAILSEIKDPEFVTDGTIDLYEDDVLLETLRAEFFEGVDSIQILTALFFSDSIREIESTYRNYEYYKFKSSYTAQAGKTYKVVASAPGYETVTASTTMPPPLQINTFNLEDTDKGSTFRMDDLLLNIEFKDPVEETNYYFVSIKKAIAVEYSYNGQNGSSGTSGTKQSPPCFASFDPYFERVEGTVKLSLQNAQSAYCDPIIPMKDVLFKEEAVALQITFPHELFINILPNRTITEVSEELVINAYFGNMNQDFYLFLKSALLQSYTNNEPFNEPVVVYSNVENGFGVLAGFGVSEKFEEYWERK